MFEGGEEYEIEKFMIHENYDPITYNNDIALFKVKIDSISKGEFCILSVI